MKNRSVLIAAIGASILGRLGGLPSVFMPNYESERSGSRTRGPRRRGTGWTAAQVKRMAVKRRNQLRMKGRRK